MREILGNILSTETGFSPPLAHVTTGYILKHMKLGDHVATILKKFKKLNFSKFMHIFKHITNYQDHEEMDPGDIAQLMQLSPLCQDKKAVEDEMPVSM